MRTLVRRVLRLTYFAYRHSFRSGRGWRQFLEYLATGIKYKI